MSLYSLTNKGERKIEVINKTFLSPPPLDIVVEIVSQINRKFGSFVVKFMINTLKQGYLM